MFKWLASLFDDSDRDGIDPYDYYAYAYLTDTDPLDVIPNDDNDYDEDDYGCDWDDEDGYDDYD